MIAAVAAVEPALYCGTYAKYNDGNIAGAWLKLADYDGPEAFLTACSELHRDEADPEFMFQDYEGLPREFYGESLSPADLAKIYDWLHLDSDDRELLAEYVDATGEHLDDIDAEAVRDKLYCVLDEPGMTSVNFAMGWYLIDERLVDIPEHLQSYIDVEALGRDSLMDFCVSSNGHVFEA